MGVDVRLYRCTSLLSAEYIATYMCYKRICLTTTVYGIARKLGTHALILFLSRKHLFATGRWKIKSLIQVMVKLWLDFAHTSRAIFARYSCCKTMINGMECIVLVVEAYGESNHSSVFAKGACYTSNVICGDESVDLGGVCTNTFSVKMNTFVFVTYR